MQLVNKVLSQGSREKACSMPATSVWKALVLSTWFPELCEATLESPLSFPHHSGAFLVWSLHDSRRGEGQPDPVGNKQSANQVIMCLRGPVSAGAAPVDRVTPLNGQCGLTLSATVTEKANAFPNTNTHS